MKRIIKLILFSDRRSIMLMSAVAIAIIFMTMITINIRDIRTKNSLLKTRLTELESLSTGLIQIRKTVSIKEKKIGLTKVKGVVSGLEHILKNIGLEADVLKPLQKNKRNGFYEEDAELEIQQVDLNSIVNLIYQIDNSPVPMKIKHAEIRTTFEDPDKFILKLTASLLSKV